MDLALHHAWQQSNSIWYHNYMYLEQLGVSSQHG